MWGNVTNRSMKVAYWLRDRIWPMLEPSTSESDVLREAPTYPADQDVEVLKASMEFLKIEVAAENERNRVVESKLQSLLAFNSVGIGIVTAMVTFLTSNSTHDKMAAFSPQAIALFVFVGAYIASQLFRAVWASIKGLQKRAYTSLGAESIVPGIEDSGAYNYNARIFTEMHDCLRKNQPVINGKVDQMEIAHTAVLNAIAGLMLLLVIAVLAVLHRTCA